MPLVLPYLVCYPFHAIQSLREENRMAGAAQATVARRPLTFHNFDEMLAEADWLVAAPRIKMLGKWPLGELLMHLTKAINGSIDGIPFQAPLPVRMLGPILKWWILKNGMSPGFKLPKAAEADAFPHPPSPQDALAALQSAVARTQTEKMTSPHPVFGKVTDDEWRRLHLRHAELHLSFAVPE